MRGLLAIAALSLISCAQPRPRPLTENTVQELQSIRNLKVYFGHQSVGGNILDGLREIETQAGVFPAIADSLIGQTSRRIVITGLKHPFHRRIGRFMWTDSMRCKCSSA